MDAITLAGAGGTEVLTHTQVEQPEPGPGEALIEVTAAGVNRADLLQRQGHYPPPPGASELPGLEVSGRIVDFGPDSSDSSENSDSSNSDREDAGWAVGDAVCALLTGGGYAQYVAVPVGQLLPIPDGIEVSDAAALPEVACTVWSNLWQTAALRAGEVLLVHGGSSGIGTMAIQIAVARGVRVAVTAGSAQKLEACRDLGAEIVINYRDEDFVERIKDATDGRGADVILDVVGAKYLDRNIKALATGGRLVVIGLQGGATGELNLGRLLTKRAAIHATSLRSRPLAEKAAIVAAVRDQVWPMIASGQVRPIIDSRFPLAEAAAAHDRLEQGTLIGKVLLDVAPPTR